ncbi:MAG: hypothetical protein DMD81_02110 [Candidatus Rokuibacteriota bacterium]|nr:MAG: hypothetical protein DMD81_02110 [Candidatus Rokubacteria bacterium]
MKAVYAVLAATMFAGCATAPVPGNVYRGEVWTWDERDSTVTLREGADIYRVQVTPDQVRRLRMHETVAVRGQRLGPKPIQVPRGPVVASQTTGRIASLDPGGVVALDTPQGRLTVWVTQPDTARYSAGKDARVSMSVQAADIVPQAAVGGGPQPSASVANEPGDHAVVTGRVLSTDSRGLLTVESPRGPITVWVPDVTPYPVGSAVQVRTVVRTD